jgi:hypothetical protein
MRFLSNEIITEFNAKEGIPPQKALSMLPKTICAAPKTQITSGHMRGSAV